MINDVENKLKNSAYFKNSDNDSIWNADNKLECKDLNQSDDSMDSYKMGSITKYDCKSNPYQ